MNELKLTTATYQATLTGLNILRPSSEKEWRHFGKILSAIDEAKQWAIGDWLVDGKSHYGDGLYEEAARLLGEQRDYLRKLKSMAERFELCTRVHNVSHKHYSTVASIKQVEEEDGKLRLTDEPDMDKMQELLAEAAREIQRPDKRTRKLTVKELRGEVQRYKQQEEARIALHNEPEKYDVIYADPPWEYDFPISGSRKIEHHHYPTMKYEKIKALKVPAADDGILFLWAPSSFVHKALGVMNAWGFEYRTTMVWVKPSVGMGQWARQRHEFLFIGMRGSIKTPADADKPDSVIEAPRGKHSEKPAVVYDIIEKMFPELRKIELFSRTEREGWKVWGDECEL